MQDSASEAIRLEPETAYTYYIRAIAYTALGKITQAQQDIERATELSTDCSNLMDFNGEAKG